MLGMRCSFLAKIKDFPSPISCQRPNHLTAFLLKLMGCRLLMVCLAVPSAPATGEDRFSAFRPHSLSSSPDTSHLSKSHLPLSKII
jgi:hypothetical protein